MRLGPIALGLGGVALVGLVAWHGAAAIGGEVAQAAWTVPPLLAVHGVNQWLSAVAWRWAVGGSVPSVRLYFLFRIIREAVNGLLPTVQLGGNLVGMRLLMQRGVPGAAAAAGTTIDVTIEGVTQLAFALVGIAVLAELSPEGEWIPWVQGGVGSLAVGLLAFVLVQQAVGLRVIEAMAAPLLRRFPRLSLDGIRHLFAALAERQRQGGMLLRASLLQSLALAFGIAESWLVLEAMGRPTSLAEALVFESLGLAVRSAGFLVPAGLGVQEAGFLLLALPLGVPPDQALALSMVKRLRELLVGVPALLIWQWSEIRRLRR